MITIPVSDSIRSFSHMFWGVLSIAGVLCGLPLHIAEQARKHKGQSATALTILKWITIIIFAISIFAGALEYQSQFAIPEAVPEEKRPVPETDAAAAIPEPEGQTVAPANEEDHSVPASPVSCMTTQTSARAPEIEEEPLPCLELGTDLRGCTLENAVNIAHTMGILCVGYLPPCCTEDCIILCTGQSLYIDPEGTLCLWLDWEMLFLDADEGMTATESDFPGETDFLPEESCFEDGEPCPDGCIEEYWDFTEEPPCPEETFPEEDSDFTEREWVDDPFADCEEPYCRRSCVQI